MSTPPRMVRRSVIKVDAKETDKVQKIVDHIVQAMQQDADEHSKLFGLPYGALSSEKEHVQAMAALQEKGFTGKVVLWPGKTDLSLYHGVLVERSESKLPPAYDHIPGP